MTKLWVGVVVVGVLGTGETILTLQSERRRYSTVFDTPAAQRVLKTADAIHLYMEDNGRGFPLKENWQAATKPYANFPVGESQQPKGGKVEFNPRLSGLGWSAVYSQGQYPMLRDLNIRPGSDPLIYVSTAGHIRIVRQDFRFEAFNNAWQAHPNDEVEIFHSLPKVTPYSPGQPAKRP